MSDLKEMPVVTVEQVNRFRDAAVAATEQSSKEIERLNALVAMQAEALKYVLGDKDDEKIGWRGRNPPNTDSFSCEFCAKSHEDCTLIEHMKDCPITIAREVISASSSTVAKWEAEKRATKVKE